MGKRSTAKFARKERDFYPTPAAAVAPLLPHLPPGATFAEPCAGDGALVSHLVSEGLECVDASDLEPQAWWIRTADALNPGQASSVDAQFNITNPPWDRKLLHPMIEVFRRQRPTWLLFDADWAHTVQAKALLPFCRKIISVGRVKWIPGSKMTGKDNAAWYLFTAEAEGPTEFYGRA